MFKFIFCFHAGQDSYFWQSLQRTCWIFNFLLPFWEHCKLPFLVPLCTFIFLPLCFGWVWSVPQGVHKLQGSNLVLHWPRWSFSWNWWAISCQTFRLICFPLAASVSFIFKRGLGSLKLLCQLRAFWVLRIYLIFMLLQLHAYDNICKEHYYLQLCASILGALCASIVDTILRFQSRPSVLESFLSWILLEHVFFTLLMLKHP